MIVSIAMFAHATPARAESPARVIAQIDPLSAPVMAVSPQGQTAISWIAATSGEASAVMAVSDADLDAATVIAPLGGRLAADVRLAVRSSLEPTIAWLVPLTSTMSLCVAPLAEISAVSCFTTPMITDASLVFGDDGRIYQTWLEPGRIVVLDAASGVTRTISTDPFLTAQDVRLAVASGGHAHALWTGVTVAGPASLYYGSSLGGTAPITVSERAILADLALATDGRPHVLWSNGEELLHASGDDWSQAETVASAPGASACSVAVSPDGHAQAAWASANGIWLADAADWPLSRTHIAQAEPVLAIELAVDPLGLPHIMWCEQDTDGECAIMTWEHKPELQISLTSPLEGHRLSVGDTLRAAAAPPGGWEQVSFYLEPADDWAIEQGWLPVGADNDGDDGWSAELGSDVPPGHYRAVALGHAFGGATRLARGPSFVVGPDIGGQVAFVPAISGPMRANAEIRMFWLPAEAGAQPSLSLDLYLRPESSDLLMQTSATEATGEASSLYYIGRHPLRRTAGYNVSSIQFDSRAIPDGTYTVLAREDDTRSWWPSDGVPIRIDNAMAPQIELLASESLDDGDVWVSADAMDPNGVVTRVDFFIERRLPVLSTSEGAVEMPQRIWFGADDGAQGGWNARLSADLISDGQGWRLMAKATDNDGRSWTTVRDQEPESATRNRPSYAIVNPTDNRELSGTERIIVAGPEGQQDPVVLEAYLGDKTGSLRPLGQIEASWPGWQMDWETTTVPDGEYRLYVVAAIAGDEDAVLSSTPWLRVANKSAGVALSLASAESGSSGSLPIALWDMGSSEPIGAATFYWRDETGAMELIAHDADGDDGWGTVWRTGAVVDGTYHVVARVVDESGSIAMYEQEVLVGNGLSDIELVMDPRRLPSSPTCRWAITGASPADCSVDLAFSPDDGHHWMDIASDLPGNGTWVLDTTMLPDTTMARVRVTATDGTRTHQAVGPRFDVDNANEPPRVVILSPQPNQSYALDDLIIAWEAADPDETGAGRELDVELAYRPDGGVWRTIRQELDAEGAFAWDGGQLAPGQTYELRVTARDALGLVTSASVEGIQVTENHAPDIKLLWPNAPVNLSSEAIILWQADDPDGDMLRIDLYYSDNGGQGWLPLAESLPNSGYYGWQLAFLPPSDQYRLRAVAADGQTSRSTESATTFTIGDRQQQLVSLTSPRGGQRLSGITPVRWSAVGASPDAQASIEIRRQEEQTWQTLDTEVGRGFYLWDTAQVADGAYDLRVTLSDTHAVASAVTPAPVLVENSAVAPLDVELAFPQSGELWYGLREIAWTVTDRGTAPLTATIGISSDQGRTWQAVGQTDGRLGRYILDTRTLTQASSIACSVMVSDGIRTARDVSGQVALLDQPCAPPQISLLGPWNDGALLRGDTVVWRAHDPDLDPLLVSLWKQSAADLRWTSVAKGLADTGLTFQEALLTPGQATFLKATATDGVWPVQSGTFTAWPALPDSMRSEIAFIAPRSGQILSAEQEIGWEIRAPAGIAWSISLEASADGGLSWVSIADELGPSGAILWDTTTLDNGAYMLRLSVAAERARQSVTVSPVYINNRSARASVTTMLSPAGAPTWSGLQDIAWLATDAQGRSLPVNLHYSVDRGASWVTIARNVRSDGPYMWDTTRAPNCDEVWLRVQAVTDGPPRQAISATPVAIWNLVGPVAHLDVGQGADQYADSLTLAWQAISQTGQPLSVSIEYSDDGGGPWKTIERHLASHGQLTWDSTGLPPQSRVMLRMRASDRGLVALDTIWEPIVVNDRRPQRLAPLPMP